MLKQHMEFKTNRTAQKFSQFITENCILQTTNIVDKIKNYKFYCRPYRIPKATNTCVGCANAIPAAGWMSRASVPLASPSTFPREKDTPCHKSRDWD
jgi:hypothetical protein